jgi:hypothetical protein
VGIPHSQSFSHLEIHGNPPVVISQPISQPPIKTGLKGNSRLLMGTQAWQLRLPWIFSVNQMNQSLLRGGFTKLKMAEINNMK